MRREFSCCKGIREYNRFLRVIYNARNVTLPGPDYGGYIIYFYTSRHFHPNVPEGHPYHHDHYFFSFANIVLRLITPENEE